jgi:hypothetical protein
MHALVWATGLHYAEATGSSRAACGTVEIGDTNYESTIFEPRIGHSGQRPFVHASGVSRQWHGRGILRHGFHHGRHDRLLYERQSGWSVLGWRSCPVDRNSGIWREGQKRATEGQQRNCLVPQRGPVNGRIVWTLMRAMFSAVLLRVGLRS